MGNLLKYISFFILCQYFAGSIAWAESEQIRNYWVVGSFKNLQSAIDEGGRLNRETAVEAGYVRSNVNGTEYYRLLIPHASDQESQTSLLFQLSQAGVDNPWNIFVDANVVAAIPLAHVANSESDTMTHDPGDEISGAEHEEAVAIVNEDTTGENPVVVIPEGVPATPVDLVTEEPLDTYSVETGSMDLSGLSEPPEHMIDKVTYLVLGSFGDYESAEKLVEDVLMAVGVVAELRDFVVDSGSVVRVLVGPYLGADEVAEVKDQLVSAGYTDTWTLLQPNDYFGTRSSDPSSYLSDEAYNPGSSMLARDAALKSPKRESYKQPENTIRPGFNLATLKE
jgi:cell division septation protein DedD